MITSARRTQFDIPLNQLLHRLRLPNSTVEKQWCQHPSASGDTPCGNDKIHNSWCIAESKAHNNPNLNLGDATDYSPSSLHTWNKVDRGFHLPSEFAPPPPEPYHSPGKGPVESRLAHWLDSSRWSDCGYSDNLGLCSSHVHLQPNRRSDKCATAGKDGRAAAVELRSGKKKGAGVRAPGGLYSFGMGHFEQWSTCWWRWLVYPDRLCRSGRLWLSFFI
jgi:hypothetical protein